MLEVYHPYASLVIVSSLVVGKALGVPEVDKFFSVAYETTKNDQVHYTRGWDDFYLVFFLLNIITLIRFLHRKVVLEPITNKLGLSKSITAKFIESGWCGMYYLVATAWGYVIFVDDPWWFSTPDLFVGYPHVLDFDMKLYYLASLAFWLQSLLSFSFEPPRKDDVALTLHHFLTVFLISGSYLSGVFRVGAAILMTQNAGDIIYYHSKLFKYAKLELLSTIGWVSFVFIWFFTRHIIFGAVLYGIYFDLRNDIPDAWSVEKELMFPNSLYYGLTIGLTVLQGLMIFWFAMILKVAYKVITGQGELKDTTDYSDEEVEAKQKEPSSVKPKKHATTTTTALPAKSAQFSTTKQRKFNVVSPVMLSGKE